MRSKDSLKRNPNCTENDECYQMIAEFQVHCSGFGLSALNFSSVFPRHPHISSLLPSFLLHSCWVIGCLPEISLTGFVFAPYFEEYALVTQLPDKCASKWFFFPPTYVFHSISQGCASPPFLFTPCECIIIPHSPPSPPPPLSLFLLVYEPLSVSLSLVNYTLC